jgi:hypothetical protein
VARHHGVHGKVGPGRYWIKRVPQPGDTPPDNH